MSYNDTVRYFQKREARIGRIQGGKGQFHSHGGEFWIL